MTGSVIPVLAPTPAPARKTKNESDLDRFSILFSPPTPRASPTTPDISAQNRVPVPHHDLLTGDEPALVSEDPLSSFTAQEPERNASLRFFDHVGRDAKAASERNRKQLLEEFEDPFGETDNASSVSESLSDLDLNFFVSKSPSRSASVPPPSLAPPVASTSSEEVFVSRHSPSRSTSFQTLSSISAKWMSQRHARSPSLDGTVFTHRQTLPDPTTQPVQISHTTPFKSSPFAPHFYTPPSGAPGFSGEQYDWDKGFSTQLEEDLLGNNRASTSSPKGASSTAMGSLMDKKIGIIQLNGRREMTVPVLDSLVADMIRPHLPALCRLPKTWSLLYSLDQHGISLNTLYTRCEVSQKPGIRGALLVIKDAGDALFGVWTVDGIHHGKGAYYGSGESFLWKYANDKFQVFKWTGRNDYVAFCETGFLSFGGGDGHYGLYLDDSLLDGSSAPCPTFNNEPLCSSGPKKGETVAFECVGLEVWGIGA